jgi:hypothetical protein
MSRRRLIAIFVAWHLFAIAVAALPPPNRLSNFPERSPADSLNAAFHGITLALDGAARAAALVESGLWWVTRPLHPAAHYYVKLTGLSQNWAMFSNPPTIDQYMRVRYYIQPPRGRRWVATELVLPTSREDRVRMLRSFRDSYRDKAFAIALENFYSRRKNSLVAPGTRSEQLPTDLAPIARYFSREFTRTRLRAGETIVRTEVWVGTAANPALGTRLAENDRIERSVVLQGYYDGPVEQRINVPEAPPYHAGSREADITWLLEYFEAP